MSLPWPEAATVAEETLEAQIAATARELPQRPLVLGGCCCAHVGAVRELARRHGRVAVVWLDAHGDL
ncbi:MAG TPA: arginase family protein, partial [Gaiellaceae bacterium]|nr:arginase family protein [Gaiellaceae bacterium]